MKDHRFLDETLTKSIRRAISLCLVLALLAGTPGLTVASAYESHDHDGTVDAEPEHDHQQPQSALPEAKPQQLPQVLPQGGTVLHSGTCGEDLVWTLDDAGTLTISGTGEMEEKEYGGMMP